MTVENDFVVLDDNKSEGSAEIEGENENDEKEEPEKILIIDPDSEVCPCYCIHLIVTYFSYVRDLRLCFRN